MKVNGLNETLKSLVYSVSIIWKASRKIFIQKLLLSVATIALPYIPLVLWRELINALVSAISGDNSNKLLNQIWILCAFYCAMLIIEGFINSAQKLIDFKYQDQISFYLDNLMVEKVSNIELAFFDSSTLKDTLDHSWKVLNSVQSMVWTLSNLFQTFIRMIVSLVMLASFSIWVVPVMVILCIPSAIGNRQLIKRQYADEKKFSLLERRTKYFKEIFFGSERLEIKLFGLTDYFIQKYQESWDEKHICNLRRRLYSLAIKTISLLLLTASELLVYSIAILRLVAKTIKVGDVTYYVSLATNFREDFSAFFSALDSFSKQEKELNDVKKFLDFKPTLEVSGDKIVSKCPEIEFKNVSFKYPGNDEYVLKNCSFKIHSGETVGLVGLNGSGKSTIVKLLLRFYDPLEGQILFDGIDAKEYDIIELRKIFGVLFQDYSCYALSARENIAMSNIDQVNDDEAILAACKKSRANEFIDTWQYGIDEPMTQEFDYNGKNLSGGQWQRLALARAFFRNCEVMLLDEPSAALDALAEHEIFTSFSKLANNKSAILISHRLSSISIADRIVVLDSGCIVEQGSHSELIKSNGIYAHLFNLQATKYLK